MYDENSLERRNSTAGADFISGLFPTVELEMWAAVAPKHMSARGFQLKLVPAPHDCLKWM